jgi:hypothetical protein
MDPQRTASMADEEEEAWQSFKEMKSIFQEASPRWWKKDFKSYVDKFIAEQIEWKEVLTVTPCRDEEGEERERIRFHGLRRLVAGAIQEWELVQQPNHAVACTELDGALVWQGRGYVSSMVHVVSWLQPYFQSEFEKVSPALWVVVPRYFYACMRGGLRRCPWKGSLLLGQVPFIPHVTFTSHADFFSDRLHFCHSPDSGASPFVNAPNVGRHGLTFGTTASPFTPIDFVQLRYIRRFIVLYF